MGNYYFLIAGLPELQLDGQKLKYSIADIKAEFTRSLSSNDMKLVNYFFMQFDNQNLLNLLIDNEAEIDELGTLSKDELLDYMLSVKWGEPLVNTKIYGFLKQFISAYYSETPVYPILSWEDQLLSLYYEYAVSCKNEFISEWFTFNLTLTNVLVAANCIKYGLDRQEAIIGNDEISSAIRTSNAKDFGISTILPEIDEMIRIAEETDLFEKERKIELLKWDWLENKGFFHFFDLEYLFIYLLKIEMLERWIKLEKETGRTIFREMIGQLQQSFEFPAEYTLNKVK
jgi:hypothetical protein